MKSRRWRVGVEGKRVIRSIAIGWSEVIMESAMSRDGRCGYEPSQMIAQWMIKISKLR